MALAGVCRVMLAWMAICIFAEAAGLLHQACSTQGNLW